MKTYILTMSSIQRFILDFFVTCIFLAEPDYGKTSGSMLAEQCQTGPCRKGEYLNTTLNSCLPCSHDTYINIENHNCTDCSACTHANKYDWEVILTPCSPDSDTVLGCLPGYFMSTGESDMDSQCSLCGKCSAQEIVKSACSNFSDVICAPAVPTQSQPSYEFFDKGVFIACMVLLIMIVVGLVIYVRRTPGFRRTAMECLHGRCPGRRRPNNYDSEILVLD